MIAFPNCKINLGLHVMERRTDGFHEIETIIYPVKGLYDSIEIIPRIDNEVVFGEGGMTTGCPAEKNLVIRAYRMMQSEYGIGGADIYLHKCIPSGAGLGGGSSDAAFMIKSVNDVFSLDLNTEIMENIASSLGSDTPFFIKNTPCICTGRGEIMDKVDVSLKGKYIVIIKPPFGISTAEAYSAITPGKPANKLADIIKEPFSKWRYLFGNDFETPLFRQYPRLWEIKNLLYNSGAVYASMSGSGSAVYGIFDTEVHIPAPEKGDFIHISILD